MMLVSCMLCMIYYCLVEIVQKRWKALRERYAKEHKKKKKKKSGDGADVVTKEWEHYQLMDFLRDFIRHRR